MIIMSFCRFRWCRTSLFLLAFLGLEAAGHAQAPEPTYQVVVNQGNTLTYSILEGQTTTLLEAGLSGWKPQWAFVGAPVTNQKATGDHLSLSAPFVFNKAANESVQVQVEAAPASKNAVTYTYTLSSDKDIAMTCIAIPILAPQPPHAKSITLMTITAGGAETTSPLPSDQANATSIASKVVFHSPGGDIEAGFNPPTAVSIQRTGIRLLLAQEKFKAGTTTVAVTYSFPKAVSFLASDAAMAPFNQQVAGSDWFPWSAGDHTSPSVFAMDDWLDKPAGKHGGVRMQGDHFQFEDGTPVKFWGTNIIYRQCAPPHNEAIDTAIRFARYGVNAVRLHKFSGAGWEGIGDRNDIAQWDPKGLEQLDFFANEMQSRGIYYGFSHTFNLQIRPGNKAQLLNYDEIQRALGGKTMGLINFAEDIQDLLIQSVVNLLNHTNPYTGKSYAQDPALCYIELQNEDDIFWYLTGGTYAKCPTYAKNLRERYADWLKKRYGSQEAVAQAWAGALKKDESLDAKSIGLNIAAYDFTEESMTKKSDGEKKRTLDGAAFLHDVQNRFYAKFVKAIRDAGYKGPLCGSPWFAPPMVPQYYNLLSDYEVGFIDRHNYFGDTDVLDTMLGNPGSGYLSTGLYQVGNRPFALSEWISPFPLVYQAEGPVIMAAYGMGLQGWDASYEFNSNTQFPNKSWFASSAGGLPFGRWVVDSPVQIGQYPALARMIYRGDVQQGEVISIRSTSLGEIAHDNFSFTDKSTQQGDVKLVGGSCPKAALAAGRCIVQFTDTPQPGLVPDMSKYQKGTAIVSTTNQLTWDTADRGFITIDTAGTKAVAGFAQGKTQTLGKVTITSNTPYASIILTALDQHATLDTTKSALLTVVARAVSTGFSLNTTNNRLLSGGKAPLLMEPVQADFAISGRSVTSVKVLDQNGVLTTKTVPVQNGAFHINSGDDQTLYYQVNFN